eukprot:scaffold252890_cov23-Prasinocladus_malaysianus.AAC.1
MADNTSANGCADQEEIEKELQHRGISSDVPKQGSKMGLGSAKEQLIQRLERARLDTSAMSSEELVTELRRISLSTDGSEVRAPTLSGLIPRSVKRSHRSK